MSRPPLPQRDEIARVLEWTRAEAERYLRSVDDQPVRHADAETAAQRFGGALPEDGAGAMETLRELVEQGREGVIASAGPRFFHFVIGGSTPAALGADWLATALDQVGSAWVTSPLAVRLERLSIEWLRDLFGLRPEGTGVLTTGAMMANFTGLAAARQWCGERLGVDVSEAGLYGLEPIPVFSSGYIHVTSVKALSMLGMGRGVRRFSRDDAGRLDEEALERALAELGGRPAVVVANAGEVNAGDFDPIERMADLAEKHGAWLHVDGAFGLFAATSPRTAHLTRGVERAHSVTVDGHKWLNVPYDCGVSFVQDRELLLKTFRMTADYLPSHDEERPVYSNLCAESSRRARSFSVWATLRAYGRTGVRDVVEGHLDLAQLLAARVDEAPDFERLADVPLSIVCFRYNPGGRSEEELDALNQRLGEAVLEDGRVYVGTTRYRGHTALRPAIVNWRTRPEDVEELFSVLKELAPALDG